MEGCTMHLKTAEPVQQYYDAETRQPPAADSNRVSLTRSPDSIGCLVAGQLIPRIPKTPSSKLLVAMIVLSSWLLDFPNDKILGKSWHGMALPATRPKVSLTERANTVFTQFITTAQVLGQMLGHQKIPFLYFYGCMSEGARNRALQDIGGDATKRVMVNYQETVSVPEMASNKENYSS